MKNPGINNSGTVQRYAPRSKFSIFKGRPVYRGNRICLAQMSIEVVDHKVLRVRMKSEINLKKKSSKCTTIFLYERRLLCNVSDDFSDTTRKKMLP